MSNFFSSAPVILKDVRIQWMNLFEPDQETKKFKLVALMDPKSESVNVAKKAMVDAAKGLWKENAENMIRSMAANNKALRSGDDKMDDAGNVKEQFKGMLYISASAKADRKPKVVTQRKHNGDFVNITADGRGVQPDPQNPGQWKDVTDELGYPITVPYRGCRVNAKVEFCAGKSFKTKGGDGKEEVVPNQVFARIIAVQFLRDDEAFGGGNTSAEGFGDEDVPEGAEGLF